MWMSSPTRTEEGRRQITMTVESHNKARQLLKRNEWLQADTINPVVYKRKDEKSNGKDPFALLFS